MHVCPAGHPPPAQIPTIERSAHRYGVVVVVGPTQPDEEQASQQLAKFPGHACPRGGALQRAGSLTITHFVVPSERVRQQVAASGLPQVEREAHFTTARSQSLDSP